MRIFHERALPDLAGNIKCGNSLIGPDFYNGQQMSLLDDDERYRINVFDWRDKKHGFGSIMAAGGFDAVIGNPPYVLLQDEFRDDEQLLIFAPSSRSLPTNSTHTIFSWNMPFGFLRRAAVVR